MNEDPQPINSDVQREPQNMGELPDADAIGTVGNAECGEMLRLWIKYKEERGKKVIDRATFQSFGCETAIAVANLATQLLRGKTREEALSLNTGELSGELGPLPPMKIHCAELVHSALRAALDADPARPREPVADSATVAKETPLNLIDQFAGPAKKSVKVVFLSDSGIS